MRAHARLGVHFSRRKDLGHGLRDLRRMINRVLGFRRTKLPPGGQGRLELPVSTDQP